MKDSFYVCVESEGSNLSVKSISVSTQYGYLYFKKFDNAISLYGTLNNLPTESTMILQVDITEVAPNYNYAILDLRNNGFPYLPVGTMWIYSNKSIRLYKTASVSNVIVSGSYIMVS